MKWMIDAVFGQPGNARRRLHNAHDLHAAEAAAKYWQLRAAVAWRGELSLW